MREIKNPLVELTSIHEPQTLFARLKSSGKDLGEGVMAGGAGEAYASLGSRHVESRGSMFEIFRRANFVTSDRNIGVGQTNSDKVKKFVKE